MQKRFLKKILLFAGGILFAFIQNTVAQINTSAATSLNKISTINKNWQQGGIFNGEYPEKEILAARTEYTKKFDKGNGVIFEKEEKLDKPKLIRYSEFDPQESLLVY